MAQQCVKCQASTGWKGREDWPMTEVDGHLVHKVCAHEFSHAVESFGRTVREGNVIRWQSNGQCPFDDMTGLWAHLGLVEPEVVTATAAAKDAEDSASIAEYRREQANLSPEAEAEQMAEMRAAFGPGETVVNVLTGRTYTT